jgi:hypothetical protein
VEEIWIPGVDEVFKGNRYFVTGTSLRLVRRMWIKRYLFGDVHRKANLMMSTMGFKVFVCEEMLSEWEFS